MWYSNVMGWIDSLPKRLRRTLQMEGEHIVEIVGNAILLLVYHFAPGFPFTRIFKRFGDDHAGRSAEETARAAKANVVAELQVQINRVPPRV
jgi:hypothetical protein